MTTTKTITARHTKRNIECAIEEAYSTRVKIVLAPAAGRQFNGAEMHQAGRAALVAALDLARAFLEALPAGVSYCLPDVSSGEVWAGAATAWVTFEHDGDATAVATLQRVVAQASK